MVSPTLLFALSQVIAAAPSTPEWHEDYQKALKEAETAGKPLAVLVGQGPAGWSKVSSNGELTTEARKLLSDKYICLYLDTSKKDGKELAGAYKVGTGPALVLTTKVGKDYGQVFIAHRQVGPMGNAQLLRVLENPGSVIRSSYYPADVQPGTIRYAPTYGGSYRIPCRG